MPNKVCIQTTEFKSVPQGGTTKGFLISDDFGALFYDNTWDSFPETDIQGKIWKPIIEDMMIFEKIIEGHDGKSSADDPIKGLLDFIREEKCGVEINGRWYEWNEIKHLFQ